MNDQEPQPQSVIDPFGKFNKYIAERSPVQTWLLSNFFKAINLPPEQVKLAIDLGCGFGAFTLALLNLCPKSQIHAIDYHDILSPTIGKNPNVTFHKGLIMDILGKATIPPADLILLFQIGSDSGITDENIRYLTDALTPMGYLFTWGAIEDQVRDILSKHFVLVHQLGKDDRKHVSLTSGAIWQLKISP